MNTYRVTLESPGLYEGSHYYNDRTVRAGSPERAKIIAQKRYSGHAIACSQVTR